MILQLGSFQFRNVNKLEGDWLKLVVLAAHFFNLHYSLLWEDFTHFFIVGTLVRQNTTSEHRWNVSIAIGGLFYYIGDNLPPLIREYQKELCVNDRECVEVVQILGICWVLQLLPI